MVRVRAKYPTKVSTANPATSASKKRAARRIEFFQ
jgi:hypothetical protein